MGRPHPRPDPGEPSLVGDPRARVLAVVLGAVFLVVGHHQIADADEGAALAQAQVVAETGAWSMPATSELDPTGDWFPVHNSPIIGDQAFPFTRPPLYPATIGPLLEAGGLGAVLGVHVLALVARSPRRRRVGERLRAGRGIQTMWLAGALSPLLFDGYWAIAHTIVAAGAVWAVWAAHPSRARPTLGLAAGLGDRHRSWPLYRNEALLFAAALTLGLLDDGRGGRLADRAISMGDGTFAIDGRVVDRR